MPIIIGFILFSFAIILETTVLIRITLLQGTLDLVMLILLAWVSREGIEYAWHWGFLAGLAVGIASALPLWIPLLTYVGITALAEFTKARIWQVPIFSFFILTLLGTLIIQSVFYIYLIIVGSTITFGEAFNLVILPTGVLNLLLALPVYTLIGEIVDRLYPSVLEQ